MINKINKKKLKKVINSLMIIGMFVLLFSVSRPAFAVASGVDKTTQDEISGQPDIDDNTLDINISSNAGSMKLESTLQILIMLTILSLAPSILIMVTSFTRIVVVFHFLRTALGTQTTPPNQVIVGLALFITIAIMSPVFTEVNTKAIKPYTAGKIKQEQAIEKGLSPLREFMLKQTREKDLKLFMDLNKKSDSCIYHKRIACGFYNRFFDISSIYSNRYGCCLDTYVNGYDDAPTDNDFVAV